MNDNKIFACRYGWFSSTELRSIALQAHAPMELSCMPGENNINVEKGKEQITDLAPVDVSSTSHQCMDFSKELSGLMNKNHALDLSSNGGANKRERFCYIDSSNNVMETSDPAPNMSWQGKKDGAETAMRQSGDEVLVSPLFPQF